MNTMNTDIQSLRLPDFYLIGAMKSGTTTLHSYLEKHPDIFMCSPKEPQFFSKDSVFEQGIEWYSKLFADARETQLCGDASTCYSRWPTYPNVPQRIAEYTPHAKFIYVIRHPVERAYSHYGHIVLADGRHYPSFEEALANEREIVDASLYMLQLEKFLEVFGREQILLVRFEELMKEPEVLLRRVEQFLDISDVPLIEDSGEIVANSAGTPQLKKNVGRYLRNFRRLPGVSRLIDLLPPERRKALYNQFQTRISQSFLARRQLKKLKSELTPLTAETRQLLLEKFAEDTSKLERFMGADLSAWKR